MIKQVFHIEDYWEVMVYYNVDYNLFNYIKKELINIGATEDIVCSIYNNMSSGKGKAVTYNNLEKHTSIILFNRHKNKRDYINSLVHEAEHVKQAMLKAYAVQDKGEDPAYTIGYLVSRMWETFRHI